MTEEMFGAILEAGKKIDYQTQVESPGLESGGMIQRINGKLVFKQEEVIISRTANSVTYKYGVEGETMIHGHGVFRRTSDRIVHGVDYNNRFSDTDTEAFMSMGDNVVYDVLVGQNGSIQVREKYQIGRRWIVTDPIMISMPVRNIPNK